MGPKYSHCRPAGTLVRAAHSVLTMASRSMAWASARRIFGSASCGWCLSNTIRRWFSAGPPTTSNFGFAAEQAIDPSRYLGNHLIAHFAHRGFAAVVGIMCDQNQQIVRPEFLDL